MVMSRHRSKQRFIKLIRRYPLFALSALGCAYLLGGFSDKENPLIPRDVLVGLLYGLVAVVPLAFIVIFIGFGWAEDRARSRNTENMQELADEDPFDFASEKMYGFKVSGLTGEVPTFTGLTGDTYKKDDSAICREFPDHVPPVSGCECGFYAFKEREDAQFELSISPGLFLIEVDLFGLGFVHKYGYRAESQRVNSLIAPKRCMRCKTLPARVFVRSFKIGYGSSTWWQWSMRCLLCSTGVKTEDKLTIAQMSKELQVPIN